MKQVLLLPGAMSRQRCCPSNGRRTTIDRQLLSMKATYFFLFAAAAVLHPYIPVYMKEIGLTPRETAVILTLSIAGNGIARSVFGALADALYKHAFIMAICCLAAAAAHVGLYFTPPVNGSTVSFVTHEFTATLLRRENTIAICVTLDNGNSEAWDGSEVEGNLTAVSQRGSEEDVMDGCSIQCCSMVDPESRADFQTMKSEKTMGEPAFFGQDGQLTDTTVWRTSDENDSPSSGNAIGNAVAGTLYETIGPQRMYQIFSGVSFAYGALLAVTLETLHRRNPTNKDENEPNLEPNVALNAPSELSKSTGSDETEANHLHDDESSPMMMQHRQPSQSPHQKCRQHHTPHN